MTENKTATAENKTTKGWLNTKDGLQQAIITRQDNHFREIQHVGGPSDGTKVIIPPNGIPNDGMHPAFFEQDEKPDVWTYKGRSLVVRKPTDFANPKEAMALVPDVEPYEFLPHTTQVIDGVLGHDHQLLFGPTGVGKSSVILQIAAHIRQPVVRLNFTTQVSVSDIVGALGFTSGIGTRWLDGPLPRAMRNGYWLLMDEFDFCPPEIASLFHPILEEKPLLCIKEHDGEVVRAHPNFRVFANGNAIAGDTAGNYTGTVPLNKALVNRFTGHGMVISIKPLTYRQELGVLAKRMPNIPARILKRAAQTASNLRHGTDEGVRSRKGATGDTAKKIALYPILSTRDVINWVTKMVLYKDAVKAAELTFLPMVGGAATKASISDVIEARFGRHVIIGKGTMSASGKGMKPAMDALRAKKVSPPASAGNADVKTPVATTPPPAVTETPSGTSESQGGRVSSRVTDPAEMRAIYKAYVKNGGTLTFQGIEQDPRFDLRQANGSTAQRVILKFESMVRDGTAKMEG